MFAETFPLSGAQQGIYGAQMLDPQSPYYVVGEVLEIGPGDISLSILQQSLELLQTENETLRIRLRKAEREVSVPPSTAAHDHVWPEQYICHDVEPVAVIDLRDSADPISLAQASVDALRIEFAEATRELFETPLCRYTIVRVSEELTWVVQIYHHIIIDGYSAALLTRRLGTIYTALAQGKTPRRSGAGSVKELVEADQKYLDSDQHRQDQLFWKKELSAIEPSTRRAEMNTATGVGNTSARTITTTVQLPKEDFEELSGLARDFKVTWVDVLIAIHTVFAHRMTAAEPESDQVLALPIMARPTPTALKTPAMAVNVLPLCIRVSNDVSFQTLLSQVVEKLGELRKHQYLRGETLPSLLANAQVGSLLHGVGINAKVFQPRVSFNGVSATLRNIAGGPPEDLGLVATPAAQGGVDLAFETDPARVPEHLAQQRLCTIIAMCRYIVNNPRTTVGELPLLSDSDRAGTLQRRQSSAVELYSAVEPHQAAARIIDTHTIDYCIDALGQRDDIALISAHSVPITAADFYKKVSSLAQRLGRACTSDDLIALRIPKSLDAAVAIFAALRAHVPFVYIDPLLPEQRQESIIADAAISYELRSEGDVELIEIRNQLVPRHSNHAEELAYVIYTSGSTGTPKGVQIPRRALEALFASHSTSLYRRPPARIAHTASFGFDASLDQLLWMLRGHCIRLYQSEDLGDADELVRTLARDQIEVFDGTPTLISALVAAGLMELPSLKLLVSGGEAMPQDLWDTIAAHPEIDGINIYGPTEATVDALSAVVTAGRVTVGKPIAGVRTYLVDSAFQLVPDGEVGELVIGGPQLANGYLGREQETAAAFIDAVTIDPQVGAERIYRTGDQMRWIPGRGYEFLGRMDDQLEINGQRIEVAEVATALRRLDDVVDAAVYPDARTHRLVAAIVTHADFEVQQIQRQLASVLPKAMVPYRIWRTPQLPTNSAGKMDYAALAQLEKEVAQPKNAAAAQPDADIVDREKFEILKECLLDILNISSADITSYKDLFSIGGDSISALRIATQARSRGLDIAPKDLLSGESLGAVAHNAPVKESTPAQSRPETVTVAAQHSSYAEFGIVPTSLVAAGQFLAADSLASFRQHAMYRTLHLGGEQASDIDVARLVDIADAMMFRHPALRMFVSIDDEQKQIIPRSAIIPGKNLVHPTVDPTELVSTLAPDAGVVWAIGHSQNSVRIVVHHCAMDALSWGILADEFTKLYRGVNVADLPAIGGSLRGHFKQLSAASQTYDADNTHVPQDTSRPRRREALICHHNLPGSSELVAELATKEKTSRQNVLLAAFHLAWSTVNRACEQAYVLEGHGRDNDVSDQDLSRTIGWFTTERTTVLPALATPKTGIFQPSVDAAAEALCQARAAQPTQPTLGGQSPRIVLNILDATAQVDFGVIESEERRLTEELTVNVFLGDAGLTVEYVMSPLLPSMSADSSANSSERRSDGPSSKNSNYLERLHHQFAEALRYIFAAGALDRLRSIPEDYSCVRRGIIELNDSELAALERKHGRISELAPASPLQLGLLYHAAASDADRYAVAMTVPIPGISIADSAIVHDSLREVVHHHRGLNACFDTEVLSDVVYIVPEKTQFQWKVHDFTHLAPDVAAIAIAELEQRCTTRKIDLSTAPILSADLIFTSDVSNSDYAAHQDSTTAKLLLGNHHIMTDGWSTQLFLDDLMAVIEQHKGSRQGSPLKAHTPFSEYLNHLAQHDLAVPAQQWHDRISAITPKLLPCRVADSVKAQHAIDTGAAAEPAEDRFSEIFVDSQGHVAALARNYGLTPATIVQASWAITLAAVLNRDHVVFGTTFSGRPVDLPGTARTIGLFINTLPLIKAIETTDSFLSIATSIAQQSIDISEHDYFPLTEVEKISGQAPLFDTAVIYENFSARDSTHDSAAAEPTASPAARLSGATHYPMTVVCPPADTIIVGLASRKGLVTADLIEAAESTLRAILTTLATAGEATMPVADLVPELSKQPVRQSVPALRASAPSSPTSDQEIVTATDTSDSLDAVDFQPKESSSEAKIIATVMSELLGGIEVKENDNFFALGGDSMLAMRLMGRLRRHGVKLSIQQIVEKATPRALAAVVEGETEPVAKENDHRSEPTVDRLQPRDGNVVTIKPGSGTPLWCVHPINGMALAFAPLAHDQRIDGPILALELPDVLGSEWSVPEDLQTLAETYAETIRRYQPRGPYRLIGYSFGGAVAETIAQSLISRGDEVSFLGILDAYPAAGAPQHAGNPQQVEEQIIAAAQLDPTHVANIRRCLKIAATAVPTTLDIRTHIIVATCADQAQPKFYKQWHPDSAWREKLGADCAIISDIGTTHEGLVSPSSWLEITRRWAEDINGAAK